MIDASLLLAGLRLVVMRWLGMGSPSNSAGYQIFLIDRYPVTNRDYLEFINRLHSSGQSVTALLPRERNGQPLSNRHGSPYKLNDDGRFELGIDYDGDSWSLDWPVIMVNIHCATAYAEWRSRRDGRVCRLPTEKSGKKQLVALTVEYILGGIALIHAFAAFSSLLGKRGKCCPPT